MEQKLIPRYFPGRGSFWNRLAVEVVRALGRDWPYLAGIMGLFGLGIWWGTGLTATNPIFARQLTRVVLERFRELMELIQGAPVYQEILVIWLNNLIASTAAVGIGLLLPIFPPLFIFGNGAVVGLFQEYLAAQAGFSAGQFYLGLIPHGILELTAVFIAAWVGIRAGVLFYGYIGKYIWNFLNGQTNPTRFFQGLGRTLGEYFKNPARYYLVAVVIMLLGAAVIEVTISPLLLTR